MAQTRSRSTLSYWWMSTSRRPAKARELTKKFEEFLRGTPAQLLEKLKTRSVKGEFVVLVSGKADATSE